MEVSDSQSSSLEDPLNNVLPRPPFSVNVSLTHQICNVGCLVLVSLTFLVCQLVGKVGDWKNHFTSAMAKEIDEELLAPLRAVDLNFKDS